MFKFNYEAAILPIMFLQVAQTKCSVRNVNICLVLKTSITDMQVMFIFLTNKNNMILDGVFIINS